MTFGRYLVSSALICRVVSNFHLVAEVCTQLENTQKRFADKADAYKDGRFFFYNPLFLHTLYFFFFFTRAKFLENKIYTKKRQFFALNL